MRRDAGAMVAARADPAARWLVFDDLKPVLTADGDLLWAYRSDIPHDAVSVFLGLDGDAPRFAAAASADELDGVATEARAAGALLAASADPGRAGIVAQGRSLLDWHARHRFCANCAAPTVFAKAGYARTCPACGAEHFPRTDPVVIMLAIKGDHALVGRQPRFPKRFFSALAGFVEPGESMEEAVARELYEEAGIAVSNVRYIASQPWPFPSSLMIGAFADAGGYELHLDGEELEEARWVTKAEVRAALAGTGDWLAPPPLAIARTLLEEWVR
ncbi:NAD(+) diphosphatase [Glacieibacterium frigidum]|uniref:NAD(+) diphosphatase n=1 Tax=Glacieibacterium frigidum TaxID=2593303 RepID=A0A552UIN1_9SPHN|nr:NAD(+) diphosphatase [Glacieibacterium frigidum]TRW18057.1 NAD(+) diphosphatase [Glacieibacterium frigidum]